MSICYSTVPQQIQHHWAAPTHFPFRASCALCCDAFEQDINYIYCVRRENGHGQKRNSLCVADWLVVSNGDGPTMLESFAGAVLAWLQAGSVSEDLAAARYKPFHLQQRLQAVIAAVGELVAKQPAAKDGDDCIVLPWPACAQDSEVLGGQTQFEHSLLDDLRGLGLALSIFATPAFYNNPSCDSVSGGHTELSRMLGRSCVCAGCRVAHYCGRTCQVQHWKQLHKLVCSKLAASAAAVKQGPGFSAAESAASLKHVRVQDGCIVCCCRWFWCLATVLCWVSCQRLQLCVGVAAQHSTSCLLWLWVLSDLAPPQIYVFVLCKFWRPME